MESQFSVNELFKSVQKKISIQDDNSYSYKIFSQGIEKITRKIGEEALEVVIAAFINQQNHDLKSHDDLVGEICDLFYHTLILMVAQNITIEEILAKLSSRNAKNNDRK